MGISAKDALITALGEVDAERFIAMVKRDRFDYTEWRRNLWKGKTIDETHDMATRYEYDAENIYNYAFMLSFRLT